MAEEYRRRIEAQSEPTRLIAATNPACHANREVARGLGASPWAVTLKLELVRYRWRRGGDRP